MQNRILFACLAALILSAGACSSGGQSSDCSRGGVQYKPGESFSAGDGCNSCTCGADGTAVCTEIACDGNTTCVRAGCSGQLCVDAKNAGDIVTTCEWREEYACYKAAPCERQADGACGFTKTPALTACLAAKTCEYGGNRYKAGETFPSTDGCNTCSCSSNGQVACTLKACVNPPGTCQYGGKTYKAGEGFPSLDGCNSCFCSEDGEVGCTLKACVNPPGTCEYDGKTYKAGESFPSVDGCNSCTCSDNGGVACTEKACPAPGPGPQVCQRSGCSGQVCSDRDVITTCEWRPEYACYKSAACERQADGSCGFTKTPELDTCLAGAGAQ